MTFAAAADMQAFTAHALSGVLTAHGYEIGDFDLEEEATSEMSDVFGLPGGSMLLRCHSTGEERLYSTGSGSAWLGAFLADLGVGHFSAAARRRTGVGADLLRESSDLADTFLAGPLRQ